MRDPDLYRDPSCQHYDECAHRAGQQDMRMNCWDRCNRAAIFARPWPPKEAKRSTPWMEGNGHRTDKRTRMTRQRLAILANTDTSKMGIPRIQALLGFGSYQRAAHFILEHSIPHKRANYYLDWDKLFKSAGFETEEAMWQAWQGKGTSEISRLLGVSDQSVRNRLRAKEGL